MLGLGSSCLWMFLFFAIFLDCFLPLCSFSFYSFTSDSDYIYLNIFYPKPCLSLILFQHHIRNHNEPLLYLFSNHKFSLLCSYMQLMILVLWWKIQLVRFSILSHKALCSEKKLNDFYHLFGNNCLDRLNLLFQLQY